MKLKDLMLLVLAIISIITTTYFGWKLERYFNYKLSYSSEVQKTVDVVIQPLVDRIQLLESEVRILKTNR